MAQQSGSDIRAGGAYVQLFSRDDLQKGLDAAQAKLKSFGKVVAGIGGGFMAAGAGILAPLAAAVNAAVDYGSEIQDASDRTGLAAEELQGLRHASEQCAVEFGTLEKAIMTMQQRGLGEGIDDIAAYADEISALSTQEQKAARAKEIFGKAGFALLPMLKGGSDGLRDLISEAEQSGLIMSGDAVSGAESFGDQLALMQKQLRMVIVEIGSSLIPILSSGSGRMMEAGKQTIDFIRNNRDLIVALGGLGVALVAGGAAMTAIGIGIVAVTTILGALLSPIGLAITALTVLTGLIVGPAITQAGLQNAMEGIIGFALEMKKAIGTAVTFIQNGDLESAWKAMFLALRIQVLKFLDWMEEQWEKGGKKRVRSFGASVVKMIAHPFIRPEDRAGFEKQIDQDVAREQQDAEAKFTPNAERAARRLELEKELALLHEKANTLTRINEITGAADAAAKAATRTFRTRIPARALAEGVQDAMDFAQQSKGTFSGAAIGQSFNVADKVVSKIQDNTKATADNTREIAGKIDDLRNEFD